VGRVTETTVIEAPVERVYQLWTDVESMPKWFPRATHISDVTGPLDEVGSKYTVNFTNSPPSPSEIVLVEPNRRHDHKFSPRYNGYCTVTFEPIDGGKTRFSLDATYRVPGGFLGDIFDKLLVHRIAEPRMAAEVPAFKTFVESEMKAPA
jgi:uncharacterized membrane protein